jgi:hypothetical protein
MREDGGRREWPPSTAESAALEIESGTSASGLEVRSPGSSRSHVPSWRAASLLVASLALALFGAGCAATATPFPVKQVAAPPAASQPPADGPRMRIVDLEEYASEAPGWVVVVGTLENGGRSTTEELRITVNALGSGDRVVTSSPAIARSQHVAPHGRTSFAAVFAQLAEVEAYHVKVLAW